MTPVPADLYAEVLHFYARQTHALDNGRLQEYARTFTEDVVFHHTPDAEPARTRAGILAAATAQREANQADPVQRRHHFTQVVADLESDGTIRTACYAVVVRSRPGEKHPDIWPSCVVRDTVVLDGSTLLVAERTINYDYL
ncbi:nuclear transport factor 2 family protein [Actinosynnema sp. NPDC051121]